eukprot:CAMPEP_0115439070 /NCGR_PEP_ID=MMETSP0271-20121206/35585_1 /TAXON_ID=71861 /ORGANISM="Scrippsiella trochoidea, Strain CCMP3099" /LENGTH=170 /DNA_ID=CAMNT_0002864747 /DNA_START=36 /DNA_END=544 /DNA_ORIENTATION=-
MPTSSAPVAVAAMGLAHFLAPVQAFSATGSVAMTGADSSAAALRGAGPMPVGSMSKAIASASASSTLPLATLAATSVVATAAAAVRRRRSSTASVLTGTARVVPVAAKKSLWDARVVVRAGASFPEGRKLRVAVIGGGPGGASCADELAKAGIETYLIERKLDNCKPCGG